MFSHLKYIVPAHRRQQMRVALNLRDAYRTRMRDVLSAVRLRSLGTALSCFEDFGVRAPGRTRISVRGVRHAILLRNGTSDFAVFRQVFLERQYALPAVRDAKFIFDAGANIGLASVYFLSCNPTVQIVAIEPDPENFAIAAENLRPFGERCRLMHGALWSHSGTLGISRGTFRDGRHWATQTLPEVQAGRESVRAYTVQEVLSTAGFPKLDLLKMDIEGAELAVFRDGDVGYLQNTKCCAVECHSDECVAAFETAVARYSFSTSEQGELLVAQRGVA